MARRRDEGFGLLDVITGMAILGVVGALFTTAILQIYRTTRATESRAITQAQLSQALMRLDKEIRYASYVGATEDPSHVGYLLSGTCVQLRLSGGQLQRRTWVVDDAAPRPTAWRPLASQLTPDAKFTRVGATAALPHQGLTVELSASDGSDERRGAITFTALNTDQDTATGADPCDDPSTRP